MKQLVSTQLLKHELSNPSGSNNENCAITSRDVTRIVNSCSFTFSLDPQPDPIEYKLFYAIIKNVPGRPPLRLGFAQDLLFDYPTVGITHFTGSRGQNKPMELTVYYPYNLGISVVVLIRSRSEQTVLSKFRSI